MHHVIRSDELPPSATRTGDEEVEAGPGDVLVVEAGTPHGFVNAGPGRLQMFCIHAAGRMVTEWLDA